MEVKEIELMAFSPESRADLIRILEREHQRHSATEPSEFVIYDRPYPCQAPYNCFEKATITVFRLFGRRYALLLRKEFYNDENAETSRRHVAIYLVNSNFFETEEEVVRDFSRKFLSESDC